MPSGDRVIASGEGARVIASPDYLFSAEVSAEALARLFRVGEIPEELRQQATRWLEFILKSAAIEIDTQNDRVGSTFTRRSLIKILTRFRRRVAQGRATSAPHNIELHLLDAETARLRHHRLAERWWGPLAHATLEEFSEVHRQAVARVEKSREDSGVLLALVDDALGTLGVMPERKFEVMARRGRLDPNVYFVTVNVAGFWTKQLGRRHDDIKGMVALAEVVWSLLGQPKKEQAIREAFARHRRWPG